MEITGTTRVDARWPLWAWCVGAAFAIVIGGGLGNWVARRNVGSTPATAQPAVTATPIVEAPAATPTNTTAVHTVQSPDPEIEIEPSVRPAGGGPAVRRAAPKQKPAVPVKKPRCNVYDHMDGC